MTYSRPVPTVVPPLLRDFPDVIETDDLIIRALRPGDAPAIFAAIDASRPELARWLAFATPDYSLDDAETYVRTAQAQWIKREVLSMVCFRRSDGVLIGSTGFHNIHWSIPSFEIGYWLDTRMTGRGYMTAIVNAITGFAFETLAAERIEIHCNVLNEASAAVARRCGYLQEAHLRHSRRDPAGNLADSFIFGMIRADYLKRPS